MIKNSSMRFAAWPYAGVIFQRESFMHYLSMITILYPKRWLAEAGFVAAAPFLSTVVKECYSELGALAPASLDTHSL